MLEGLGDRFQRESKYVRGETLVGGMSWESLPEPYKFYTNVQIVNLPEPKKLSEMSLDEALRKRESIREYSSKPIQLDQLSYILWAANGIRNRDANQEFRTAPSAGALYPIETYLLVSNVSDLYPGIYHYSVRKHELETLKKGNFTKEIVRAGMGQEMLRMAAVTFIWTAIFERSKWKYRQRAYRYIYLDAGHIAQNLALAATSLGLGSCQIGALYDDEVNLIIGVDGIEESVLYMSTVGQLVE
ncbi:MAG: SagB/ThcOx family dehydrogenase [Candidatus Atribacteria bacterium]|nr:SagB/ThcOx family dehydrogenase [Candidatus Atribacteria bacterium]